jgi:hypothetical protein
MYMLCDNAANRSAACNVKQLRCPVLVILTALFLMPIPLLEEKNLLFSNKQKTQSRRLVYC